MIEIDGLTKRYGDKAAVNGLSFVVEPGVVTGFLGPNGAGKSTTMRMIAGLDRPTSVEEFVGHATGTGVLVRTPETGRLGQVLAAPGVTVTNDGTDLIRVSGITAEQIGAAAWRAHLPVYELTPTHASLEEAFMQVTKDSIEYHAGATR
jgi:ABC-type molybdenum transport system ATPase subunit/photorepair protein PhrA